MGAGRVDLDTAYNDYSEGGFDYFQLKNDGDSVVARILDVGAYIVHELNVNGKKKYVQCLRTQDCPGCLAGSKPKPRVLIFLYVPDDDKIYVWERGRRFIPKINGLKNKYGNLINREFEIERHGKPKDTNTDYAFYPLDQTEEDKKVTINDFPDLQTIEDAVEDNFVQALDAQAMTKLIGLQAAEDAEVVPRPRGRRANRGTGADVF